MFAFARIYNVWHSPDDGETNPFLYNRNHGRQRKIRELHDRMLAMLLKDEWADWLDPQNDDTDAMKELFKAVSG